MKPNGQENKRRSRKRLWDRQGGKCYFCGILTVFAPRRVGKTRPQPNIATIEHLDDRYNPNRGQSQPGEQRRVMACWQCNHDRNVERQRSIPIDELRRRAGHC